MSEKHSKHEEEKPLDPEEECLDPEGRPFARPAGTGGGTKPINGGGEPDPGH